MYLSTLKTLEGVFDGRAMFGDDGKSYPVPPNYASKSRLLEGDRLKLTITEQGQFIYKQLQPIKRKRLIGKVILKGDSHYQVVAEGKYYNVLNASISFYKAQPGDEAVVFIPIAGNPEWAAVENVIKNEIDKELSL